ncbi:MAG: hypothetical protein KGI91_02215 [Burkholderiales bacterium]|nr:hypothetical protein [Burkholderiales bacterium]MDE2434086.1 hypothetical protein [Burkholderiales bacterium]
MPWQAAPGKNQGKTAASVPACDEASVTELLLNKHGQAERALVRDPGLVPVWVLRLAARAELHREGVVSQLLLEAKAKDKTPKMGEALAVVVYWAARVRHETL